MNFTKRESAVSPVIGTILLVAIAVVLVAIVLAVVMGFSGDTNEKKVGMNAKSESGANATLILYGGASIDELVKLEMIDQGSANGSYVKLWENTDGDSGEAAFVGVPYLAVGVAQPLESMAVYDTRINVRGTFSDGTEVILLVQPMTFTNVSGQASPVSKYISTLIHGDTDILENLGQTYTLSPDNYGTSWWHTYTYGDYLYGSLEVKLVKPIPADFGRWELLRESEADGKNPALAPSQTYTQKTDLTLGSTSLIYMGVQDGRGGPWRYTITIYDKDDNIIVQDSAILRTPIP